MGPGQAVGQAQGTVLQLASDCYKQMVSRGMLRLCMLAAGAKISVEFGGNDTQLMIVAEK